MINSVLEKKGEKDKNWKKLSVQKKKKRFLPDDIVKKIRTWTNFLYRWVEVELGSFTNDYIRLVPNIDKYDKKTYDLLNRPAKKYENSITIAWGINYYGVSKLILSEGTMIEFSYGQTLLFYKEDIYEL